MHKNLKIIIILIIGFFFSGAISFVVAESLINSKDVVYEDNSNLAADNVQEAIDGTCSKIDTRLAGIEDNLYTIKKISYEEIIKSTKEWSYTGVSLTLPANSCCAVDYYGFWRYGIPSRIMVAKSPTGGESYAIAVSPDADGGEFQRLSVSINECVTKETTRYIWAKFSTNVENAVGYEGFCATKYK